ncbi:MAG: hypothetical protein ACREIW_05385 [Chthoniobacterales bacterium]
MAADFKIDPSDNGNEFLCLKCQRSSLRSGTHTELQVFCAENSFDGGDKTIPFRVTQCSEYYPREIQPRGEMLKSLQAQAYYLVTSVEGRGFTMVDAAEFKRRCATGTEYP